MSLPYIISAAFSFLLLLHLAVAGVQPQSPPTSTSKNSMPATTASPRRRSYIREFLQAHNKFRSAFHIQPLTWDRNLTRFARRWGEQRAADCRMIHSYGPYGENMFWGKLEHWTPTEVVNSWAGEDKHYNLDTNECADGQTCGHYTQIIWKESLRLGCVRVNCDNGGLLVICEYDPPGNYVNEKPI
uniref:SCP domain-containing protein n=1 Tax=Cucumis sativus TaxID=3659 RepID=A0A0A0LDA7_CUCSA